MIAAIAFVLQHRKWFLLGGIFLAATGGFGVGFYKGFQYHKDTSKVKTIEKIVTITEKKNEIRNNRPNDRAFFDSLRNGEL